MEKRNGGKSFATTMKVDVTQDFDTYWDCQIIAGGLTYHKCLVDRKQGNQLLNKPFTLTNFYVSYMTGFLLNDIA